MPLSGVDTLLSHNFSVIFSYIPEGPSLMEHVELRGQMSFKVESQIGLSGSGYCHLCCRNLYTCFQGQGEKECLDWFTQSSVKRRGYMVAQNGKLAIFDSVFALEVQISLKALILIKHDLCTGWWGFKANIWNDVLAHCKHGAWVLWPMGRKIWHFRCMKNLGNDHTVLAIWRILLHIPSIIPTIFNILSEFQSCYKWLC